MPVIYQVDSATQLVKGRAWGVLTRPEVEEYMTALKQDERITDGFRHLFDLSDVLEISMGLDDFRLMPQLAPFGTSRQAYFTDSDVVFGVARMFQSVRDFDRDSIRVVRTREQALEWLGLDDAN